MGNVIGIDLFRLDRDVRAATVRVTKATRALRRGAIGEGSDPFVLHRHVSSQAGFDELDDLPKDPFVEALRDWVRALTIVRVTWKDEVRTADAWHRAEHRSNSLEGEWSARDLLRTMLREHRNPSMRRNLAGLLGDAAGRSSDAVRVAAERRAEAIRLLLAPPEATHPPGCSVSLEQVQALAREVLDVTEGVLPCAPGRDENAWEELFHEAQGRDAHEGWPAALRPRWLADLFGGTTLVTGLELDVAELPEALGATSFCRALALFGQALVDVDLPTDKPFAFARSPFDALGTARAVLFGSLPAEPAFAQLALGLGRAAARDQAQRVGRALARSLRVEALRVLLAGVLLEPRSKAASRGEEESALALGAPIPPDLIGLLPRLSASDPARFLAILAGIRDRARLREQFDEDWFENPRAHEALRSEHHQAALARIPDEGAPGRGLAALRSELAAVVG